MEKKVAVLLIALVLLVSGTKGAYSQQVDFALDMVETFPAQQGVPVGIFVSNTAELSGVQIGIQYDHFKADATGIDLTGGVLENVNLEFSDSDLDVNSGEFTYVAILDSSAPFDTTIAVGTDQYLGSLLVDVKPGLMPNTTVYVDFVDGVGDPPIDNAGLVQGLPITPAVVQGGIMITNENYVLIDDTVSAPGEMGHVVPIIGMNTANLQGFSIAATYDQDYVQGVELSIVDTITEAVGAEFVETIIDNDNGFFILGVLLDLVPPFDGQTIPASGLDLSLANFVVDVLPAAAAVTEVPIEFQDGLGTPGTDNLFVINLQGIAPQFVDGVIQIIDQPTFIRGEVNGDGRVDIADAVVVTLYVSNLWSGPICEAAFDVDDNGSIQLTDGIYLLSFQFLDGPAPPAPFPLPGMDSTPPFLPCDAP